MSVSVLIRLTSVGSGVDGLDVMPLVYLQRTSQCKTWNGQGDAAAGSMQSAADVVVSTTKDSSNAELISVEEVNAPRSKSNEFILRHITKFQEIVRDLNSPVLTSSSRTAGVAAY